MTRPGTDEAMNVVIEEIRRVGGKVKDLPATVSLADKKRFTKSVTQLFADSRAKGILIEARLETGTAGHPVSMTIGAEGVMAFNGTPVTNYRGPQPAGSSVWGPEPSAAQVVDAQATAQARDFADRGELAAQSVTRRQVAELLSISEVAVTGYLTGKGGKRCLLGFKVGSRWAIPRWQLAADTERGFLPGIDRLARAFPGGIVQLSRWVQKPHPDFGGRPPRDVMAAGGVEAVIDRAASITAAGW